MPVWIGPGDAVDGHAARRRARSPATVSARSRRAWMLCTARSKPLPRAFRGEATFRRGRLPRTEVAHRRTRVRGVDRQCLPMHPRARRIRLAAPVTTTSDPAPDRLSLVSRAITTSPVRSGNSGRPARQRADRSLRPRPARTARSPDLQRVWLSPVGRDGEGPRTASWPGRWPRSRRGVPTAFPLRADPRASLEIADAKRLNRGATSTAVADRREESSSGRPRQHASDEI
jgi:hypothetical protein